MESFTKLLGLYLFKNIHKICKPLQSRCLNISVKSPNETEIRNILTDISFIKNIEINPNDLSSIIKNSRNNLKIAISSILIKSCSQINYIDPELNEIITICNKISFNGELSTIYNIKDNVYSLIIKGVDSNKIITEIYNFFYYFFLNNTNYVDKCIDLANIIAYYDSRIVNHCKDVIHIEGIFYNILSLMFNNKYYIDEKS